MYIIKLENFEGPLDLLLKLIEKEKLDICEISLAQVTSQFLDYFKKTKKIKPGYLADFLVVASTLILIKSKALLPQLNLTEEEETDIEELKSKLRNYQKLKEIVKILKPSFKNKNVFFSQRPLWQIKTTFYPPENLKIENLYFVARKIVSDYPFKEELEKKQIKKIVLLENKIMELRSCIEKYLEISLFNLVKDKNSKIELTITFLAVLHLIKDNFIVAKQRYLFGEIEIKKVDSQF